MNAVTIRPHANQVNVCSTALEKSKVVATGPIFLDTVCVFNSSASTRYLHIFDATSLPANSTVPNYTPIPIAAGTTEKLDIGLKLSTGCVVALSSTAASLTIIVSDEGFFHARHLRS